MDTPAVEAFVREMVVPLLRPGQILVPDNVATHKGARLRRLVEAAGRRLAFLPAYSPDLSPIAGAFAQVKAARRWRPPSATHSTPSRRATRATTSPTAATGPTAK